MDRRSFLASAAAAWASCAASLADQNRNPGYALQIKPVKTIASAFDWSVACPQLDAREWLLFSALPQSTDGQEVLEFSTSPPSKTIQDLGPNPRPLSFARIPADRPSLKQGVSFQWRCRAKLSSRLLITGARPPASDGLKLTDEQAKPWLSETPLAAHQDPAFQKWLDQRRLRKTAAEGEIDFARRVFSEVAHNFQYDYQPTMNRKAAHVCQAGVSDCGGLAVVFVSALRASQVAARMRVGRWAMSEEPGKKPDDPPYLQEHVKAEFFAPGVGWVPVDLSSAVLHDRTRERLYFFGRESGDFLTFHHDDSFVVDTLHFGRQTLDWLQSVAFWVTGAGSLDPTTTRQRWTVS